MKRSGSLTWQIKNKESMLTDEQKLRILGMNGYELTVETIKNDKLKVEHRAEILKFWMEQNSVNSPKKVFWYNK